jgi:hypothetical protein
VKDVTRLGTEEEDEMRGIERDPSRHAERPRLRADEFRYMLAVDELWIQYGLGWGPVRHRGRWSRDMFDLKSGEIGAAASIRDDRTASTVQRCAAGVHGQFGSRWMRGRAWSDYMISGQSINLAVHAEKTCPFMIRVEVGTVE